MKITALTSCCVDFYPESAAVFVGGNSLNFATQCKISDVDDVSIIGGIGKDPFGDQIARHLENANIDHTRVCRMQAPTASNKIYISEEGDRYFKADSWNGGAFDEFRLSLEDWDYLQGRNILAMPAGDPNLEELLKRRNSKQLVVIDFLDYFTIDFIAAHLANIDVAFLSGKKEMLNDLEKLARASGTMIVATLGADGSVAFTKDQTIYQAAVEVDEIIDTTGCGDAFQAAFSIEWFKSQDIHRSLQSGAEAASRVLAFKGGVE